MGAMPLGSSTRCNILRLLAGTQNQCIKKNVMKKYLSPSRQRALRRFFVQRRVGVQTIAPPKPAAGLVGVVLIARSARL